MSEETDNAIEKEKHDEYLKALKTNRCVDIMSKYYAWKGKPTHAEWIDDTEREEDK